MKKLLTAITAGILLTATTSAPSHADLRQQYQQGVAEDIKKENFHQQAFANAQYLRGSEADQVNVENRIYIAPDNSVYEVSKDRIKKIGYTDRVAKGCRFACRLAEKMVNDASIQLGSYTDYAQADITEEWQYFIEDGVLVEYSSTTSKVSTIQGNQGQSSPSASRTVVGLPLTTLQSYQYTTPIRPFHPDNTAASIKQYTGTDEGCIYNISAYGVRPEKCTEWENNNPEVGFNLGYEVKDQNGWTWCLSFYSGFLNVEEYGREKCEGPLTTRVNNQDTTYVAGMALPRQMGGTIRNSNGSINVDAMAAEAVGRIFGF